MTVETAPCSDATLARYLDAALARYLELGYVESLPVLSPAEISHYRAALDETCAALGGRITRLDGPHLYFRWAWQLSTHPRLLEVLERLLGPDIVLESTRIFYKHPHSGAFVGWHQDGITQGITHARKPAVWLGLTPATAANGCLRVIPRTQNMALMPHDSHAEPPSSPRPGWAPGHALGDELSGLFMDVPAGLDPPHDVEMQAGHMSVHHPCVLHGSNPNRSDQPRIGLSATYLAAELADPRHPCALVRGQAPSHVVLVDPPPESSFADQLAAYRASSHQIHSDACSS